MKISHSFLLDPRPENHMGCQMELTACNLFQVNNGVQTKIIARAIVKLEDSKTQDPPSSGNKYFLRRNSFISNEWIVAFFSLIEIFMSY